MRVDAAVDQLRDVRVLQPRQQFAFAAELILHVRAVHAELDQLQRDALGELAVRAFGEPHAAHAAAAEFAHQAVGADELPGFVASGWVDVVDQDLGGERVDRAVEQLPVVVVEGKQDAHMGEQAGVAAAFALDEGKAVGGFPPQRLAQQGRAAWVDFSHRTSVPARHRR